MWLLELRDPLRFLGMVGLKLLIVPNRIFNDWTVGWVNPLNVDVRWRKCLQFLRCVNRLSGCLRCYSCRLVCRCLTGRICGFLRCLFFWCHCNTPSWGSPWDCPGLFFRFFSSKSVLFTMPLRKSFSCASAFIW